MKKKKKKATMWSWKIEKSTGDKRQKPVEYRKKTIKWEKHIVMIIKKCLF